MTYTESDRVDTLLTIAGGLLAGCAIIALLVLAAALVWLLLVLCTAIRGRWQQRPDRDPPTLPGLPLTRRGTQVQVSPPAGQP